MLAARDEAENVDPIKSSLPYLLQVAGRLQGALYSGRTASCAVTPAGAYVLYELSQREPLTPKDLSERLRLGPAAIGQTLTRLERDGFITRRRSTSDRRWVEVMMTDLGRETEPRLREASEVLIAEVQAVLGPDGERALRDTLLQLIAFFGDKAAEEGAINRARIAKVTGSDM